MNATHVLLGLIIGLLALAAASTRPATDRSRSHASERRRAFIEQNPTHVHSHDILALLRTAGMPAEQAHYIVDKAEVDGIKPFTLWLWLNRFDAEALGLAVAADLTQRQMLTHLSNDTTPDADELRLFASFNGLPLDGARNARAGLRRNRAGARRAQPIFEPGLTSARRAGEGGLAA